MTDTIKTVTLCPCCSSRVRVVGDETQHYEPVETSDKLREFRDRMLKIRGMALNVDPYDTELWDVVNDLISDITDALGDDGK